MRRDVFHFSSRAVKTRGFNPLTVLSAVLATACIALGSRLPVSAHDSPEHVIEILTARMEAVGRRPDLLWRRATEYRAINLLDEAALDLKAALKLDANYLQALSDLCRVQQMQGKRRQAMSTINRALRKVRSDAERAPLWMLRGELLRDNGEFEKALADCDRALRHSSGRELEWYLTRSELQCKLGKFNEAVAGLKHGFELTGSAVLDVECVDALIEACRFEEALEKIGPALEDSRWQSSWLIRRARVELGQGKIAAAHADLLAAVRELNLRLNSTRPDYGLLAARGLAYALLGDLLLAQRDLEQARKQGADVWTLRRLEVALAGQR